MFSLTGMNRMPSSSSIFTAYASASASIMLLKTMVNQIVPTQVQRYIISKIYYLFSKSSSNRVTFIIEDNNGMTPNLVYGACETYLCTNPNADCLKICQGPKESNLSIKFAKCEKIIDSFEGMELQWRFINESRKIDESRKIHGQGENFRDEKRLFELSFDKEHKDKVLDSYLPFVLDKAKAIKDGKKAVKLHTLSNNFHSRSAMWDSINLQHPSTFDTLAMDPDLKKAIIDDLDRFVERKEFYKKVGKAWKRGYLLYGPPGTGKSSLIAAMANYLKFDVYDLQLTNLRGDSDLRKMLLATGNRSMLVIEDIDCSVELTDGELVPGAFEKSIEQRKRNKQVTLSGLLNFIDGLWSSCGDERIIIFTTNNKEKLDPALLRPGRMDVHIHMSYCTIHGFRILASNYLDIHGRHRLYRHIEDLVATTKVTPAEVAGELMKSDDADVSLEGLVSFLKRKRTGTDETMDKDHKGRDGIELQEAKKLKTDDS